MLLLTLALLTPAAPNDGWRTIKTEHYTVHYPIDAEEWAMAAASRLEAIREHNVEQVGWELKARTTVLLSDPYATSNGMAIPLLKRPRTELWLTPPGAASPIGWNRRWDEGLIVHEDAHLVHLSRPSRGGLDTWIDALTGIGPIARKSPRWVAEGYATVVEGDQTGFGRPYAAAEAAATRRLATDGVLPAYNELNGTARWGGGGFAYGIGAAYLRWLRDRAGPDSLRHLWARMSAKENRSFEEAFEGVFGDEPDALYGLWVAQVTADAMALQAARPPQPDTRWIDLAKGVGAPALSPDGAHLAVVVTDDDRRVLKVYETEPDPKAAEKAEKARTSLLNADPEDVPDLQKPEPTLKKPRQRTRQDRTPSGVRWVNNTTLLFAGRERDPEGRGRWDLYTWNPKTGEERRVTKGADIRDADPSPDGTFAVGVRMRWGASCLARVHIESGAVDCLTPPSVDLVVDGPRIDPTGTRLLWLEQADGPWVLKVAQLSEDGLDTSKILDTPARAQLSTPTWHPEGDRIVASLGWDSLMELAEFPLDGGAPRLWTKSHGGALAPTLGDNVVYWLDQDSRGYDVHRAEWPTQTEPLPDPISVPSLAVLDVAPVVSLPLRNEVRSTPYKLGKTESRWLLEANTGRKESNLAGVIRLGDVVGRHEALLRAGRASTPDGHSLAARATLELRSAPSDIEFDSFIRATVQGWRPMGGAGIAVRDRHLWPWGEIQGGAGTFAYVAPQDDLTAYAGHGDVRFKAWEPTGGWISTTLDLAAVAGEFGAGTPTGTLRNHLRIGLLKEAVSAEIGFGQAIGGSDASALDLGGVQDPFLPIATQRTRIFEPALPRGTAVGSTYSVVQAGIGAPQSQLFLRRHHIGDSLSFDRGHTFLGVSSTTPQKAQPLVGLPAFNLDVGLSVILENQDEGWLSRPLRDVNNYAFWTGIRWGL
ncbi:MAG: TolB family protein [Myxococcota bacterium]